jgi:hypothetical protein
MSNIEQLEKCDICNGLYLPSPTTIARVTDIKRVSSIG